MLLVNLPVYLSVLFGACIIAAYFLWKLYTNKFKTSGTRVRRNPNTANAGPRRRTTNVTARRRLAARMQSGEDEPLTGGTPRRASSSDSEHSQDDVSSMTQEVPKKKIGTKKAAKLAEKERRKEEREAEERYREQQRKKEDQEIAKRKKAEEEEERAAAEAAAAEAKRLEEEAAREQAEYEKIKVEFCVEDEGTDVVQSGSKAEHELNAQIISTVKQAKIIQVEHLALQFELKTDACVERLKQLMSSGQLTGVLDDRGKFVHITLDEYERVAQFIERRGRVPLSELVENGPKLLNLNPVTMA